MSDFHTRLADERLRLGLTQEELGRLCGVQRIAQMRYERGQRSPDARYLQLAAKAGVDLAYLFVDAESYATVTANYLRAARRFYEVTLNDETIAAIDRAIAAQKAQPGAPRRRRRVRRRP